MSEQSDLRHLLTKLEAAHFEHFAEGTSADRVAQVVCAFLNTGGGTVLVDVGIDAAEAREFQSKVEAELHARIVPSALWSTVLEQAGRKFYCIIDVPAGRDRPYTVNGTIYIRRGAETAPARVEEIRSIVESSFSGGERWERKLIPDGGVDRLDENLLLLTADEAKKRRNYPFRDATDVEAILSDLSMYRQQAITHAAEVVFGRRPALPFPQIRVRVTIYSSDKGGEFADNRQFEAAAMPMLEDVFALIQRNTPVAGTFRGGLKRTDQPAYPEAALREGLVNAFVHRDYANFSGGIAIDMYPGRLVIWNSGSLPAGMKIGDLKREHPSMPRNPDIAQVFFLRGYMERVGRGTQKILSECKDAGLPAPVWKANDAGVTLTFHSQLKNTATRLNLRQRKLLDELKPGGLIRLPEYCNLVTVSDRQARRDLGDLVDRGLFEREGEGPSTVFRRVSPGGNPAKPGQTRPR